MTPHWGSFPFCRARISEDHRYYPVGFEAPQIMDAFFNWKSLRFNLLGTASLEDYLMTGMEAMSLISIGGLAGLDIALDTVVNFIGTRNSVAGTLTRRTDSSKCNGVSFVYNQNLCFFEIDFSDTVRDKAGSRSYLYYPKVRFIVFCGGFIWSNLPQVFLANAYYRPVLGGIDFQGSAGVLGTGIPLGNDILAGSSRELVADPYLSGAVAASERLDEITFSPPSAAAGATITITGMNFDGVQSVSFGRTPAQFSLAGDKRSVLATVPANAPREPIILATPADEFSTREYFRPL